jgi:hypothetical protein
MGSYSVTAVFALEENVTLAWVMTEEHPLNLLKLMLAERRFM